jgi:hypothetical protein
MKEYDKRNSHISNKLHLISIFLYRINKEGNWTNEPQHLQNGALLFCLWSNSTFGWWMSYKALKSHVCKNPTSISFWLYPVHNPSCIRTVSCYVQYIYPSYCLPAQTCCCFTIKVHATCPLYCSSWSQSN